MKIYQFRVEDDFFHLLKVESAKADKTMKDFIIEAVQEKIEKEKTGKVENATCRKTYQDK